MLVVVGSDSGSTEGAKISRIQKAPKVIIAPLPRVSNSGKWIEVKKDAKGRLYWGWRWMDNGFRKSKYGGKFELLSRERQDEYGRNRERRKNDKRINH